MPRARSGIARLPRGHDGAPHALVCAVIARASRGIPRTLILLMPPAPAQAEIRADPRRGRAHFKADERGKVRVGSRAGGPTRALRKADTRRSGGDAGARADYFEPALRVDQEFYRAIKGGNTTYAERLIAMGALVDWQDADGLAPLHLASRRGASEIVTLLVDNKCDVNITDDCGTTPLVFAISDDDRDTARLLIRSKADVDKSGDIYFSWKTPLHIASELGNTDTARLLIESKAAVDKGNRWGATPLYIACQESNMDTVRLLIESKAAVDKADEYGDTPLINAAYENHMTTVRALVEAGADTTIRGDGNKTAAERARQSRHHHIAEYLVNDAPRIRFHPSARNERGKLYEAKGRAKRAATRDLADIAGFDRDMMGLLDQFCAGKR